MFAYPSDCFYLSLLLNNHFVGLSWFSAAGSLHPCLYVLISVYLVQINTLEKLEKCILPSLEHPPIELKPSFVLCFGSLFRMQSVSGSGNRLKKGLVLT